jgi:hypothetical protein
MNKIIVFLASLLISYSVFAENPCQVSSGPYGPMVCSSGIAKTLTANGAVTLNGTTVQGDAKINGDLSASNAIFTQAATVVGDVTLKGVVAQGETSITGSLDSDGSVFDDKLTVAANTVTLHNTTAADIVINSGDGIVSPQTLVLSGKTEITGNITFVAKDGIVKIDNQVKLLGKVIGAQVVKVPSINPIKLG